MVGFPSIHFGGRWWEIQPTPSGISIHWMDFHLVVGIPSILDRFPTTWMEIQPIGLVGPDVAVLHWYSSNWNAPPAGKVLCVVCSSKWGLERSRHVIGGTQQPGQSPKLNPNLGLTTSFHFALLNVYFYWKSSTTSFCSSHPDPLLWKGKMRRGRTTSKIIARRHHHNSIQVMIIIDFDHQFRTNSLVHDVCHQKVCLVNLTHLCQKWCWWHLMKCDCKYSVHIKTPFTTITSRDLGIWHHLSTFGLSKGDVRVIVIQLMWKIWVCSSN